MIDLFPLYLTLKVSIVATFFSIIIGLGLAWLMARKEFFGKGILDALVMQPIVIPPTVLGYYLLVLLGRSSPFGRILEDTLGVTLVFTWKAAVVAAFVASLPLFVRPARAAIEGVDKNLENAARLLGKTEWEVLKDITIPLAWRGIAAGSIIAFARATGEFGATLMVAGNIPGMTQTIPIAIYDAVQMGNTSLANLLVGIITLFSFSVIYFVNRFTKGRY
ncbi:MAG: molybdate ABC transporter permease subunit [Candidatus Omnitrophica bacterium]|nr:molybdate ABC transporter permease subunit [Candidatus Omnitrophota bacterium]